MSIRRVDVKIDRGREKVGKTTIYGDCDWISKTQDTSPIESIDGCNSLADLEILLKSITGFFLIRTYIDNDLLLCTDIINSIPFYHTIIGNKLLISDNQEKVAGRIKDPQLDKTSVAEYQNVGYCTGPHTLLRGMSQSDAAMIYRLKQDKFQMHRYFDFDYCGEFKTRESGGLGSILDSVIERLINQASGREIWVPLSGGQDSRLILAGISNRGYDNLHAYTYGKLKPGSEASVSKKVAKSLDVDWHCFEYQTEDWHEWYRKEWRSAYDNRFFRTTVPPIKEIPALRCFLDEGIMDTNAIIVPGHSGDMVAGSHLAGYLYPRNHLSESAAVNIILNRHYKDGFNNYKRNYEQKFNKRISRTMNFKGGSGVNAMNACERWNWRERQSKWISTFIKQYEFLDLDWWMPMWDKEFVDFWMETNPKQRLGKRFYRRAAQQVYEEVASSPIPAPSLSYTEKLKIKVSGSTVESVLRPVHRFIRNNRTVEPEDAYQGILGIMRFETFKELYNGDRSERAYRSEFLIDEMGLPDDMANLKSKKRFGSTKEAYQ